MRKSRDSHQRRQETHGQGQDAAVHYTLQLPANYDPTHPYRVVFGWHGANENMDVTVKGSLVQPAGSFPNFGLQPLANNSAILVAPDALN